MKFSKPVAIGAAVLAVAILLFLLNGAMEAKAKALAREAVALERARAAESKVAEIDSQLASIRESIAVTERKLELSKAEASAREAWFQAQLAKIPAATPVQLVDQGSAILQVTDIVTDGQTVSMSVETYRKVVFSLVEHQEYVSVRAPAWSAREALYQVQIAGYKESEIAHAQKDASNEEIKKELRSVISKHKSQTLLTKAAWAAGGFVVGSVASKLK